MPLLSPMHINLYYTHRLAGWEVDGTSSGLYQMAYLGADSVESTGSAISARYTYVVTYGT